MSPHHHQPPRRYWIQHIIIIAICTLLFVASGCGSSKHGLPQQKGPSLEQAIADVNAAPTPDGVDPQVFAQLKEALIAQLKARPTKLTTATQGQYNEIDDIFIQDNGFTEALYWEYKNVGDYDLNGEVNISDLTPLGAHLGKTSADDDWEIAKVADGDGNGALTIADITPIGANFLAQALSYNVYASASADGPFEQVATNVVGAYEGYLKFDISGMITSYSYFQVKPVDSQGGEGVPSEIAPYEKANLAVGELHVNLESILIGLNQPAIFGIDVDPALKNVTVEVWELDANGVPVQKVADLKDDGNVAAGDDILLDGHYSGTYTPDASAAAAVDYFAKVDFDDPEGNPGTADSNKVGLLFYNELTLARAQEILDLIAQHQATLDIYGVQFPTPQAGAQALFDQIKDDPEFEAVGLSESGQGVWWVTKGDLIPCAVDYFEPGERGGGTGGANTPVHTELQTRVSAPTMVAPRLGGHAVGEPLPYWQLPQVTTPSTTTSKSTSDYVSDLNSIGNNRALFLAPYRSDFAPSDETPLIHDLFLQKVCPDFEENLYSNAACTVEVFKTMADFGVVMISTHGNSYFGSYTSPMWGGTTVTPDTQCVFNSREAPTAASMVTYSADLIAGRLVAAGTYRITPSFVREYCDDMPNTIVYIGSCRSTWNDSLADAFTDNGAGTFVGFSDYVGVVWAFNWGMDFWTKMLASNNTGGAWTAGQVETDADPARYDLRGSGAVKILAESLRNPGFDEPLTGWTRSGDCRGIHHLGFIPVVEGRYMAITSTGLGSVSDSQSALSQRFCVPMVATSLGLDYNVVSEEPLEFLQTAFDDRWSISLYTPSGTLLTTFVNGSVNTTSGWAVAPAVDFFGGDATAFQTGWTRIAPIDMTPYRGTTVDLVIECNDIGDSLYDTAVLVDRVQLI
ncbi:MAG: hypothetical protein M3R04_00025 [bacterium]|nr:hypothetical protein [bacterium]